MNEYTYTIPNKIIPNKGVYEFVNILYSTFKDKSNSKISLLSENTKFIDPLLMAPLGLVLTKLKLRNNYIVFNKLNKLNYYNLNSCGFLKQSQLDPHLIYTKLLLYKTFNLKDYLKFKQFLSDELLNISDKDLVDTIISHLSELFENVRMHSGISINSTYSQDIFISGYYDEKTNYINFSICNIGDTFKDVILSKRKINYEFDYEYIKWSLIRSNTTRDLTTPGGLGLFMIYDFIKKSHGNLYISSGKGYCEIKNNSDDYYAEFSSPFPGTSISLSIPIEKIYKKENLNLNTIFSIYDMFKED